MEQIIASIDRKPLERPKKRHGVETPSAKFLDPWHGPPNAAPEFSEKVSSFSVLVSETTSGGRPSDNLCGSRSQVKEMTKRRESEKAALSKWLRNGQIGGTKAIAKELNKSVAYVEGRLRNFETTRGVHRWTGPVGPTKLNATASSVVSKATTVTSGELVSKRASITARSVPGAGAAPTLPSMKGAPGGSLKNASQKLSASKASMVNALPPSASMAGSILPPPVPA